MKEADQWRVKWLCHVVGKWKFFLSINLINFTVQSRQHLKRKNIKKKKILIYNKQLEDEIARKKIFFLF